MSTRTVNADVNALFGTPNLRLMQLDCFSVVLQCKSDAHNSMSVAGIRDFKDVEEEETWNDMTEEKRQTENWHGNRY